MSLFVALKAVLLSLILSMSPNTERVVTVLGLCQPTAALVSVILVPDKRKSKIRMTRCAGSQYSRASFNTIRQLFRADCPSCARTSWACRIRLWKTMPATRARVNTCYCRRILGRTIS